jgi:hypothetical protein
VAGFLKQRGITEIRKVCLVACHLGAAAENNAGNKTFLERFAEELDGHGYRPKIAGWEDWVSIIHAESSIPASRSLHVGTQDPSTTEWTYQKVEKTGYGSHSGRKMLKRKNADMVARSSAHNRDERKRYVWVKNRGENAATLSWADWHDR